MLPWLYPERPVLGADFSEALAALLGRTPRACRPRRSRGLKAEKRRAGGRGGTHLVGLNTRLGKSATSALGGFSYIWADGGLLQAGAMAEEKHGVLVIVGADEYGRKELLAMTDGFRESTQSWREVLLDLKKCRRGLKAGSEAGHRAGRRPRGSGPPCARCSQRRGNSGAGCNKTMNVLNAMPKSVQAKAKAHLHDIWQAEQRRPKPTPPSTSSSRPTA